MKQYVFFRNGVRVIGDIGMAQAHYLAKYFSNREFIGLHCFELLEQDSQRISTYNHVTKMFIFD